MVVRCTMLVKQTSALPRAALWFYRPASVAARNAANCMPLLAGLETLRRAVPHVSPQSMALPSIQITARALQLP
jgi:hypothetical protein